MTEEKKEQKKRRRGGQAKELMSAVQDTIASIDAITIKGVKEIKGNEGLKGKFSELRGSMSEIESILGWKQ